MTQQDTTQTKGMRPIWYFVGWLLLIIGCIVCAAGIYGAVYPPEHQTVLYKLHTGIWWGAIITVAGLIFLLANRNATVQ